MTKKAIMTVIVFSVVSAGIVGATTVFAQGQNSVGSLAQEIASKFNLNQNDVQAVVNQHQQEVQAKQEAKYENYLADLVKQGKITQQQEQLILTKHNQLISQIQSFASLTPAQRRAQMQTSFKDLRNWAKQNNITLKYLRPFGPGERRF